jgi:outer membrane receptor protein involved in Fe transport
VTLTGLLEHRDELFGGGTEYNFNAQGQAFYFPDRSQSVNSAYGELKLPVITPKLELQLAGRHDDYRVHGATLDALVGSTAPIVRTGTQLSSTDITVGLRYEPIEDVTLRASYGTGFLPPAVTQLASFSTNTSGTQLAATIIDPLRGNTSVTVPYVTGGNPALLPERSKSWSAGAIFTPRLAPGLRFSIDYSRIDKTDNISDLEVQQIVDNASLLPGRVTRGPVSPGDPYGVGPIASVNDSLVNISKATVVAYDLSAEYRNETARFGTFDFYALGSWEPQYRTQLVPGAPYVENVGINASSSIPLKWKANAGVNWSRGGLTLGWAARYFDSYLISTNAAVLQSQGNGGSVPSQIYHDVFSSYRFHAPHGGATFGSKFLERLELQGGVRNVFDKAPPITAQIPGYSILGDPRLRSYYLTLKCDF